ncbi:MAG TPA: hypothetical protein VKZ18_25885 [Polyangia bacterium]|nr:hypothetical protein [Polyangia bacterium]
MHRDGPIAPALLSRLLAGRGFLDLALTIASVCLGLDYAILSGCNDEPREAQVFGVVLVSSLNLAALGELVICLYRHRRRIIVSHRASGACSIVSQAPVNTNARLS